MRFLADENVSRLVVERLRAAGFEVASVRETTPGAPDKGILDAADSDDRVLITEDRDFGELVIRQRLKVRGIILLELDRVTSAAEAELVAEVVRVTQASLAACACSRTPPAGKVGEPAQTESSSEPHPAATRSAATHAVVAAANSTLS